MKIAYITASAPFGETENFIVNELAMLKEMGADLIIFPRGNSTHVFHKTGDSLAELAKPSPLISFRIAVAFLHHLFFKSGFRILTDVLLNSRSLKIAVKNFAVFPKSTYLARVMKEAGVAIIHAHWGTTTSTMAYVIHRFTHIPWGVTLHRWDITEDNLLQRKIAAARFVRCISESAKTKVGAVIGQTYHDKIAVLHMGVDCSEAATGEAQGRDEFIILVPATYFERKGHKYLIDSIALLKERDVACLKCYCYGSGPIRKDLELLVRQRGLQDVISIAGYVPQEKIFAMCRAKSIDLVVLPSIDIGNEDGEGIPVALMDAMACGIPVLSTDAGGIPELIGDGSGVMVKQRDAEGMAEAIEMLMTKPDLRTSIGARGRHKVEQEFNLRTICQDLMRLFMTAQQPQRRD